MTRSARRKMRIKHNAAFRRFRQVAHWPKRTVWTNTPTCPPLDASKSTAELLGDLKAMSALLMIDAERVDSFGSSYAALQARIERPWLLIL